MTEAEQVGAADKATSAAWLFHIRDERKLDAKTYQWKEPVEPEASPEEQAQAKELYLQAEGASLLTETGQGVQFYHQLIQEYFCAYHCEKQAFTPELLERTTYHSQFDEVWPLWAGLSEQGEQSLLTTLISWLQNNSSEDVRRNAAGALGKLGDSRAVGPLISALLDEDSNVRDWAAEALGNIGEAALEPLIAALHGEDSDVRENAAIALGNIGDIRALPHLEQVVQEDKGETSWGREVADVAAEAIEKIKAKRQSQL